MSEKEKLQGGVEEIKKFEEEVEEAIDELFVPLSGDNSEVSEGTIDGKSAEDEKKAAEAEKKSGTEKKIEIPNLESSIEAAIDELFVDTTTQKDSKIEQPEASVPEATGGAPEITGKTQDVAAKSDTEEVASDDQLNADIVDSLKEKLLSLDWEISAANIRAMEKALSDLPPEVTSNAKIVSIVRMMQGVLKYLATVRYSASPLSIQFLRDAMEALEKLMVSPGVSDKEGKKIIGDLVNKFRRLKYEAKKYQKVKVKKELAGRKIEERELPGEVIPDVLQHIDQIQKNFDNIVAYNKKIKVCINRVQNLLNRYERLQAVLERKPALAKVSNYFGETTKGMVQEIGGIENYLRELNGIFEESSDIIRQHKEILEKKSVSRVTEKPSAEEKQPSQEEILTPVKDEAVEMSQKEEPSETVEASGEETLVMPPPVGEKPEGTVAAEEAVEGVTLEPVEESQEEVPSEPSGAEEIPDIEISSQAADIEEVAPEAEEEAEAAVEEASEEVSEVPPEVSEAEESKEPEKVEKSVDSEASYEPVYLVTIAGQVLAIPSRYVAKVYSLPEKKIGLINSKGYAFLKELKPLFRSIKHGLSGPLAQKTKGELKNLKADVIKLDLKSLNISEENIPEKQKGLVLLSNGDRTVLLCTDETVSKRPTPVTNFDSDNMGGCLSGRVEIEGQFNVPMVDVEKLLTR